MRSEQILIDAGQAIRDFVLSTADDVAFSDFLRDLRTYKISYQHVAQLSGIDMTHILMKDRAGAIVQAQRVGMTSPYAKTAAAEYVLVKLTQGAHGDPEIDPDWQSWWLENCPDAYQARAMADHIDNATLLDAIFIETHDRLPAPEGRDYYMNQRRQGRSWGAICAEIERHAG